MLPAQGGVAIQPYPVQDLLLQPFSAEWGRYFQSHSDYAAPQVALLDLEGEPFWREYGEPLDAFVRFALLLLWTFRAITHPESFDPSRGAYPTEPASGLWELNRMAARAAFAGKRTDDGKVTLLWQSPSLIGSYAVIILSDLAGEGQVRTLHPLRHAVSVGGVPDRLLLTALQGNCGQATPAGLTGGPSAEHDEEGVKSTDGLLRRADPTRAPRMTFWLQSWRSRIRGDHGRSY